MRIAYPTPVTVRQVCRQSRKYMCFGEVEIGPRLAIRQNNSIIADLNFERRDYAGILTKSLFALFDAARRIDDRWFIRTYAAAEDLKPTSCARRFDDRCGIVLADDAAD